VSAPQISIIPLFNDDPLRFDVSIRDGGGVSRHQLTMSRADLARLGGGADADAVIAAAFRFLLEREPKEAILSRFDINVISRYFPDFESRIGAYLPAPGKPVQS
jgi:hypothetical protein